MDALRLLERLSRRIVAEHLDVQVERSDDGTAPRQPDTLIQLADGTTVSLEVVSDYDVTYNKLSDALERQGESTALGPDEPSWYISLGSSPAEIDCTYAARAASQFGPGASCGWLSVDRATARTMMFPAAVELSVFVCTTSYPVRSRPSAARSRAVLWSSEWASALKNLNPEV
ncbi:MULTISPECIES: hypothetical protein [Curtobacterium]|jgi:hypothetical protein|uniref:Uncharacterized protein n=2 Tax=Curtobacterium TaxID=2034 RepID=A0A5P8YVZ3_9MICO|nr:hypothetical protein [Curtobacterium flaccumfaciens]MBO9041494.1 hypothetical protein [Curtobacterium flaccumfaciens pv. flaccumfaciens]MBO9044980.1 hypothetical protein [Curtobacterium flaccumfaciens pv. flaccumfaciens]MBO9048877.1 hypothetical protein [Curtobacterium flaccumfaciens pv. flaccumfaciens]MBO9057728.1 hypothetical protein [Curtobacterium flaccumfaciens pv. flaccumfaciens]MBT1543167.1 hypothetical protein [Curtobacterium flaccumfaciens pv. flaccumfaciens]